MKRKLILVVSLVVILLLIPTVVWAAKIAPNQGEPASSAEVAPLEVDTLSQLHSIMLLTSDIVQLHELRTRLEQDDGLVLIRTYGEYEVRLDISPDKMDDIDRKITELIEQLKSQVNKLGGEASK